MLRIVLVLGAIAFTSAQYGVQHHEHHSYDHGAPPPPPPEPIVIPVSRKMRLVAKSI